MKTIMILLFCTLVLSAVVSAQTTVPITGTASIPAYATKVQLDSLNLKIIAMQVTIASLQAQLGAKQDTSKSILASGLLKNHFILFDGIQAVPGPLFIGTPNDTMHLQTIQVWSK